MRPSGADRRTGEEDERAMLYFRLDAMFQPAGKTRASRPLILHYSRFNENSRRVSSGNYNLIPLNLAKAWMIVGASTTTTKDTSDGLDTSTIAEGLVEAPATNEDDLGDGLDSVVSAERKVKAVAFTEESCH